jgi:hypothetical protein
MEVEMCLQSALNHMSLHGHTENYEQAAKAAACAMSTVTRAKASCPAADRDLREGIKQAEMLRDAGVGKVFQHLGTCEPWKAAVDHTAFADEQAQR